jgi:spermidine synthase
MSIEPAFPTLRLIAYGATIFLSSAALMLLEISAGRLIAPYVGVSLYSWTSIIGVVLGGLSVGNWLGGIWADRGGKQLAVGLSLALGGIFSMASLLILTLVAPWLQGSELSLLSSSFLYVLFLFFLPALLLGVVTPLLTTMALTLSARTGQVVGSMHALAAFGSIVGTFVTGFWLIQRFGTHSVIVGIGVVLMVMALPFLLRGGKRRSGITVAVVALATVTALIGGMRDAYTTPCDVESAYFCIRVVDDSNAAPFGNARSLVLDHLDHGTNHAQQPTLLLAPYVHLMDELVLRHFDSRPARDYFFAGGGAYTHPRALLARDPANSIHVAEIDPMVTLIAQAGLFVDVAQMKIEHTDARVALQRQPEAIFDVIVTDAFHDLSVPYHLLTEEYFSQVRARLRPDGIALINLVDVSAAPKLIPAVLTTLRAVFPQVQVWVAGDQLDQSRTTYVLVAGELLDAQESLDARFGLPRIWWEVSERVNGPASDKLVLRDDFVPVERLVSPLLTGKQGL